MNIAIVVGVSKYVNISNLPGCRNDSVIISELVNSTNKFDRVLVINDDCRSEDFKLKLRDFIKDNASGEVDEVFFYYSGHGLCTEIDFYFLLTDYDSSLLNTTSISNADIDNLIRSLSPKIYVKVIDACESGRKYIKNVSGDFGWLDHKPKSDTPVNVFSDCYFMYSSRQEQSSFQNKHISDFTKAFFYAIKDKKSSEVMYEDIKAHIADRFEDNLNQTPYFNMQGTGLHSFGVFDENNIKDIESRLLNFEPTKIEVIECDYTDALDNKKPSREQKIVERIVESSKDVLSSEVVNHFLKKLYDFVDGYSFGGILSSCYDLDISKKFARSVSIDMSHVAKILDSRKHIFSEIIYKSSKRKIRRKKTAIELLSSSIDNMYFDDLESYEKPYLAISTANVSYEALELRFKSKYEAVDDALMVILPYCSKFTLCFFVCFAKYKSISWNSKKVDNDGLKWIELEFSKSGLDKSESEFQSVLENLKNHIESPILDEFSTIDSSSQ